MNAKVFVAGASGVIGTALVPQLRTSGFSVVGTARSSEGLAKLSDLGVEAVEMDIFDSASVMAIMKREKPDVVINMLTDLSGDGAVTEEMVTRNARIRREGTANLLAAVRASEVKRVIAQSIAWSYAPSNRPALESDPLDVMATGTRRISICEGVVPLELAVLSQLGFTGIVLRLGQLYGPGTWANSPSGASPVHVDAAANAACLAVSRGTGGAYNIAEQGGAVSVVRALWDLSWNPEFRLGQAA